MATEQRPALMTWMIALLFTLGLFNVIYAFTGAFAPYGIYYSAGNVFLIILMFAALSGLWSMEKWGLWLFLVFVALKLVLDLATGAFHFAELFLLIPALVFLSRQKSLV
jgi:hypothetical protein